MNALNHAGIRDPSLRRAYAACRRLHATRDPATFPSVFYLPPAKRPYVHALYAFARHTDDLADGHSTPHRPDRFRQWAKDTRTDLTAGTSTHPVRRALLHTLRTWGGRPTLVDELLTATEEDLTFTPFATYQELARYLYGVNSTVCLLLLPILQPAEKPAEMENHIAALGRAIQYVDNLLDLPRDIRHGRLYLPLDDLQAAGLTQADLRTAVPDPTALRRLALHQVERVRGLLDEGRPAIQQLHPTSRPPIECALAILEGYLSLLERHPASLLRRRVPIPPPAHSLTAAATWYARSHASRRRHPCPTQQPAGA
ncbi:hypothetical protein AQI88_41110 [Streptomyces cellostaticus]|uniref:Phytoene synthase n=1 Tax=Streptomyces cellostaticus TaxID=67285 RepID=A0A101N510_9ACTN|nr:phytoene/squalene synthase family protein [Streptomyces cellostaticus]KUM86682.1 hypothetical protein AQI88_41110 [Streptomyces cellostaticus]GHI10087.1 phytoene synthase [Streptomyces cellostaticus]